MGRNRKKHKKKQKEKVINYSVKNTVPASNETIAPIEAKSIVKKSVNWSKVKIMPTGRGRRGPIYV